MKAFDDGVNVVIGLNIKSVPPKISYTVILKQVHQIGSVNYVIHRQNYVMIEKTIRSILHHRLRWRLEIKSTSDRFTFNIVL